MGTHIFQFIIAFLAPVVIAIILTPWVIKFAYVIGAIDEPDERKVHQKITPRLGGMVIFLTLAICSLLAFLFFDMGELEIAQHYQKVIMVSVALTLVFFLGIWDDITPLKPGIKFGLQFLIASMVYFAGVKISSVMNPLNPYVINVQLIDYPLTILWIVGITNAINLIDGLDGLASGVTTIACVSIFAVSALTGEIGNAYVALILAGSLVGFLRYNFNPAKIFLGDSGSLLLGFLVAVLSIQSSNKVSTGFSILFPILVLGLPIADTLIAMLRRFLGTFLENTPQSPAIKRRIHKMFLPDKSHIHHQLLQHGLTHRNTVILLYVISSVFALSAFSITIIDSYNKAIIALAITAIIIFMGIKKLKYREIDVLHNGIFLPFYERFWLNRSVYKSLFDLFFISAAFTISFFVVQWTNSNLVNIQQFQIALVAVCSLQMFIFWISGLYRDSYEVIGLGDALKIAKYVGYAVAAIIPVFIMFFNSGPEFLIQFFILNFYLLLTFILGFRISYQALKYLFFRTNRAEKKVLIYGANNFGNMLLDQLMSSKNQKYNVLGFIDENHEKEGTLLNGFQVFGGHWKLERLYNSEKFDMILMTDEKVKPEVMRRIKGFSDRKKIPILKFQLDFESVTGNSTTYANNILVSEQMAFPG
ncbi:MAG TPA: hypothetical protein VFM80_04500 [Gracilimonas sp.]|uniref:PglD-related sugar-binding protein n=1 Tax=Gracilimonas sp. TaxID=1974203 RepID=UPI002DAC579A|nr:hypothetical protein [Gracilimonas sp.]